MRKLVPPYRSSDYSARAEWKSKTSSATQFFGFPSGRSLPARTPPDAPATRGRIVLSAELVRKGGGVCWQDRTEGASENYGYSGATDNYQETLNHALDRAMIRLLGDPGFQKSICSCGR
jgi:hypothetical protein